MTAAVKTLEQFEETFLTETVFVKGKKFSTRVLDMGNGYYAELEKEKGKTDAPVILSIRQTGNNGAGHELVDAGYPKRACVSLGALKNHLETLVGMKRVKSNGLGMGDEDFNPASYDVVRIALGMKPNDPVQRTYATGNSQCHDYYKRLLANLRQG